MIHASRNFGSSTSKLILFVAFLFHMWTSLSLSHKNMWNLFYFIFYKFWLTGNLFMHISNTQLDCDVKSRFSDGLNVATPVENTISVAFSSGTKQHATSKPDTELGTSFCFFSTCFRAPVQLTVHFPDCLLYVLDWDACLHFFDLIMFTDQTQHVFYIYILIVEAQNNVF